MAELGVGVRVWVSYQPGASGIRFPTGLKPVSGATFGTLVDGPIPVGGKVPSRWLKAGQSLENATGVPLWIVDADSYAKPLIVGEPYLMPIDDGELVELREPETIRVPAFDFTWPEDWT